jgi:OmcA/MtrC family decaheme c-type cytochrome
MRLTKLRGARGLVPLFALLALGAGMAGCEGDDGSQGPPGPQGPPGDPGPTGPGVEGPVGGADGDLSGQATVVTIDSAAGQKVTVRFTLADAAGLPVTDADTNNFEFQIAKLVPASTSKPQYWQSYINRSDGDEPGDTKVLLGGPERDKPTLVDAATGTYEYTFCTPLATVSSFIYYGSPDVPAGNCTNNADGDPVVGNAGEMTSAAWAAVEPTIDVSYQPEASTRITIVGRDGAFVNIVQDFVPSELPALSTATVAEVVTNASCGACHAEDVKDRTQLLIMRTKAQKGSGHLGRRYQVEVCVMCHNATGYDYALSTDDNWVTLDLKELVHDLHTEGEYPQNTPFGGVSNIGTGFAPGANPLWAQIGLPGLPGTYNCRTCHDNQNPQILPFQPDNRAAADKDAWQVNITQQGCGSCHPVNFTNHFGNQPDNQQCELCHGTDRSEPVTLAHATPYSTPNNPDLYPGAKQVEYAIQSVTVDAAGKPTVRFSVKVDGVALDLNGTLPTGVTLSSSGANLRLVWSKPMAAPVDGMNGPEIVNPKDWNNFGTTSGRAYWNGELPLGPYTMSTPTPPALPQPVPTPPLQFAAYDQTTNASISSIAASLIDNGDGTFSTIPGITATGLAFPAGATLRAVAIESYLVINGMNISAPTPIKGVDGENAVRRTGIVDLDNCNTCHERIGFHSNAGRMANVEYCSTCHNPELSNSNIFVGEATFALADGTFKYRQTSNNFKDMIHSIHAAPFREEQNPDDPYNFIRSNPNVGGGSGPMVFQDVPYPLQVSDCQACHKSGTQLLPEGAAATGLGWSVYDAQPALGSFVTDTPVGVNAFNPLLSIRKGPAAAACTTCHNSAEAAAHVAANTSAAARAESCVVCHGEGRAYEAHGE